MIHDLLARGKGQEIFLYNRLNKEIFMGLGRMALLWILGVPIFAIIILKLLGII